MSLSIVLCPLPKVWYTFNSFSITTFLDVSSILSKFFSSRYDWWESLYKNTLFSNPVNRLHSTYSFFRLISWYAKSIVCVNVVLTRSTPLKVFYSIVVFYTIFMVYKRLVLWIRKPSLSNETVCSVCFRQQNCLISVALSSDKNFLSNYMPDISHIRCFVFCSSDWLPLFHSRIG